ARMLRAHATDIKCINTATTTQPRAKNNVLFRFFILRRESSARVSIFINREVNTGFIIKATRRDENRTRINVMGRYFINSPNRPGQNAIGTKAAIVVAVLAMIGTATSPAPYLAASMGLYPR